MSAVTSIVDLHAHILPGLDDGAKDWEESCRMLDIAASVGIGTIIATPHYSRHLELKRIREASERLNEEAQKRSPQIHIYVGQEILYFDSIVEVLGAGAALTLAGSRYILVEFMPSTAYKKLYQGIRNIQLGGYYPVLAHVERYDALRQPEQLEELRSLGCLLQMNYSSLQGHMFDKNANWCRKQIQEEQIHLLSTDMHRSTGRSPEIRKSLAWLSRHTSQEYFGRITGGQASQILHSARA